MKLIKPTEISARILTLLDESDERVVIVSPYMKISKWYKLQRKIKELSARRVRLEIYVRDDPENTATYRDLDYLELEYHKIPHLHSKLYLNERCGILTSMNLLLSSEINSLEIGSSTDNQQEYNELLDYYQRYILRTESIVSDRVVYEEVTDHGRFMRRIKDELRKSVKEPWIWLKDNTLHICTGRNNYKISINDAYLCIMARSVVANGIKQRDNQSFSLIVKRIGEITAMEVLEHPGPQSDIIHISGQLTSSLESTNINGVRKSEEAYIIESVLSFIGITDSLLS